MRVLHKLPHRPAALLVAAALLATPAAAQAPMGFGRTASFVLGASAFDASGTGTAPTLALRVDTPLRTRWLLAEASLGYSPFDEQFSSSQTHFGVLEGQLQLQVPLARVRPYLGVGGGWASYLSNARGRERLHGTGSAAAGLRVPVTPRVAARAELRVRGWQFNGISSGYTGAAAETTFGFAMRF